MLAGYYGHEPIVRLLLKAGADATARSNRGNSALDAALHKGHSKTALPLALAVGPRIAELKALFKPSSGRRPPPARPPPANPRLHYAACWYDRDACEAAARARDAEAFKGGMTVKEINAAFGERAGELKKPAKRLGLIDMGLIHLFMM